MTLNLNLDVNKTNKSMATRLTPKSALLLAAITITAIDGELDVNEVAIINRLDGFSTSTDWEIAVAVWNETALEDCIIMVSEALNPRQQRITIANLIDIAMADGSLHEAENTLLRAYTSAFSVSDKEIERIVDVITLKSETSSF